MKKKADEHAIMNELRRGSVFFPGNPEQPAAAAPMVPAAGPQASVEVEEERAGAAPSSESSHERPADQLVARGERRRRKKRHPFEFYEDQLATLKLWSLEEQLKGGESSMSEMVREAVDAYIAKRRERAQ